MKILLYLCAKHIFANINRMKPPLLLSAILWLVSAVMSADDCLPVVEIKADRMMIYPQRLELTGEETLMDVLLMVPDLMISSYEDVLAGYNLRIDNVPMNGDSRLILSQMKAKDIAKIQVCDNTGVQKGTIGKGRVLDINMLMPDSLKGFVEGQGDFGKNVQGIGTVHALYGSKSTDIYANVSYRYQEGSKEYVTLHMTNRFDSRNRLLTYFTQQYQELPASTARRVMGRARFFHTFNDWGTELLLVGGYQYVSDPLRSNRLPLCIAELNTPLLTKRLFMTLGYEGNFVLTEQKSRDCNWDVFNHDLYLQFTYSLPQWRFTVGDRVMFYRYKLKEGGNGKKYADARNNMNACAIFVPSNRHQVQLGYYRKFFNPSHDVLFTNILTLSDEEWAITKGKLDERYINQVKLAYAYSKKRLTVQTEASYYSVEDEDNYTEVGASAYWKTSKWMLAGGTNLYMAPHTVFASIRCAPTVYLPCAWRVGMQMAYYTKKSPIREQTGVPVYGCLSVDKQLGRKWCVGIDWHNMFDACGSESEVNRHAGAVKLQYRF